MTPREHLNVAEMMLSCVEGTTAERTAAFEALPLQLRIGAGLMGGTPGWVALANAHAAVALASVAVEAAEDGERVVEV